MIDLEVASAWRRLVAAGDLDERRAQLALDDLDQLRLERAPHGPLLARCWELRHNLTIYDAAALSAFSDAVHYPDARGASSRQPPAEAAGMGRIAT